MKQQKKDKLFFISSLLMLSSSLLYAAEPKFSIIPTPGTSTSFLLPSNFIEKVRYQVTNQTKNTRTLTMVPITGVSQSIIGPGVCSNPFTLGPQQSCLLNLFINGSQVPNTGIKGGPVICKTKGPGNNSPDPFLCSQPNRANTLAVSVVPPGQHAYIANQLGNSVSFCQINPVTGSLSQCFVTATGLPGVEGIGFNPTGTLFYSANPLSNSISVCQVNQQLGLLFGCTNAGGTGFNLPNAISFSPDGTMLYTSNLGGLGSVSACSVNPVSGFLSACVNNFSPTFGAPAGMTLNAAGTLAYIANRSNNTISICNVSGQAVNSCNNLSGSLFNGPEGVIISPNGLHAYITNAGDRKVIVCNIRQNGTGLLDNCIATNGPFSGTGNVGLNNLGTFAFVPNETPVNDVFTCQVTQADGALSDCRRSPFTDFTGPAGIAVR